MIKKIVAILALALFLGSGFTVMLDAGETANAESTTRADGDLTLDGWVLSKAVKAGDIIDVCAETSYTTGVTVTADIVFYDFDNIDTEQPPMEMSLPITVLDTITLSYDDGDEIWKARYAIPLDAEPGVYGAEFKAVDGTLTVVDTIWNHIDEFQEDYYEPLVSASSTFINTAWKDTIDDIKEEVDHLTGMLQDEGGIHGLAVEITSMPEYTAMMDDAEINYPEAAAFIDAVEDFLLGEWVQDTESLIYDIIDMIYYNMIIDFDSMETIQDKIIGSRTMEEIFLDNLTRLLDVDAVVAAWEDLKASEHWIGFEAACEAFMDTSSLNTLEDMFQHFTGLLASSEFEDFLAEIQTYAESYNTTEGVRPLQKIIYLGSTMDEGQMENMTDTGFFQDFIGAIQNISFWNKVNNSVHWIEDNVTALMNDLVNATQLEAVEDEIERLGNHTEGFEINAYNGWWNENDAPAQDDQFEVKDWMMGFELETDIWWGENCTLWINLTSPSGQAHRFVYTEEEWYQENFTNPELGVWEIEWNYTEDCDFDFWLEPRMDFMSHMAIEVLDEAFMVFNMGLTVETDYLQEIGDTAAVDFTAFNAKGALKNTQIEATVVKFVPSKIEEFEDMENITDNPFDVINQAFSDQGFLYVYHEATLTTDENGKASTSFSLDEEGVYLVVAQADRKGDMAFGVAPIFALQYVPQIGLEKVGEIAGLPVYENPGTVGAKANIGVTVPGTKELTMSIEPLELEDMFGAIEGLDYVNSSTTKTITNSGTFSLLVDSPLCLMTIFEEGFNESISFPDGVGIGFIVTSDVDLSVSGDVYKGKRNPLTVSSTGGTVQKTYGLATYGPGIDFSGFGLDITNFTKLGWGIATGRLEAPNDDDIENIAKYLQNVIYGDEQAYLKMPALTPPGDTAYVAVSTVEDASGDIVWGAKFGSMPVKRYFFSLKVGSPVEVLVTDSHGNRLGFWDGTIYEEIPNSYIANKTSINPGDINPGDINPGDSTDDGSVNPGNMELVIFAPDGENDFTYKLRGTGEGTYSLKVVRIDEDDEHKVETHDIPIEPGVTHEYVADWGKIVLEEEDSVTVKVDEDGDGTYEKETSTDSNIDTSDVDDIIADTGGDGTGGDGTGGDGTDDGDDEEGGSGAVIAIVIIVVIVVLALFLFMRKKPSGPMQTILAIGLAAAMISVAGAGVLHADAEDRVDAESEEEDIGMAALAMSYGLVWLDTILSQYTISELVDSPMMWNMPSLVLAAILYVMVQGMSESEAPDDNHTGPWGDDTPTGYFDDINFMENQNKVRLTIGDIDPMTRPSDCQLEIEWTPFDGNDTYHESGYIWSDASDTDLFYSSYGEGYMVNYTDYNGNGYLDSGDFFDLGFYDWYGAPVYHYLYSGHYFFRLIYTMYYDDICAINFDINNGYQPPQENMGLDTMLMQGDGSLDIGITNVSGSIDKPNLGIHLEDPNGTIRDSMYPYPYSTWDSSDEGFMDYHSMGSYDIAEYEFVTLNLTDMVDRIWGFDDPEQINGWFLQFKYEPTQEILHEQMLWYDAPEPVPEVYLNSTLDNDNNYWVGVENVSEFIHFDDVIISLYDSGDLVQDWVWGTVGETEDWSIFQYMTYYKDENDTSVMPGQWLFVNCTYIVEDLNLTNVWDLHEWYISFDHYEYGSIGTCILHFPY